jgi:hypothetical protein
MVRRLTLWVPMVATALPAVVLGVMTAGMLLMGLWGARPDGQVEPVNMSEAAALRDQATILVLMKNGEDPYARREIRADFLFNDRVELTPFEAAIAAERAEVMEILLWAAPRPAPAVWTRLRCLAGMEGDEDITEVLDRYRPDDATLDATLACEGVTRPW